MLNTKEWTLIKYKYLAFSGYRKQSETGQETVALMGWLASVIQRQSSSPGSTAQLPVQLFRRLVVTLRDQQSVSPQRGYSTDISSQHTPKTTEPFSQAKQADVGIIHLYCEQL